MNIFPFRLRFTKLGKMRFLSHHDVMRLFSRAIRRADLPIRFSEGFTPRPMMSFPLALGIGIESLDEILEIELSEWVAPVKIQEDLNRQLPEGVRIEKVEPFQRKERLVIESVDYEIEVTGDYTAKIQELLGRKEILSLRERGEDSRFVDIRPYVGAIVQQAGVLKVNLRVLDSGSARPQEVLAALGIAVDGRTRMRKVRTRFKGSEAGSL